MVGERLRRRHRVAAGVRGRQQPERGDEAEPRRDERRVELAAAAGDVAV